MADDSVIPDHINDIDIIKPVDAFGACEECGLLYGFYSSSNRTIITCNNLPQNMFVRCCRNKHGLFTEPRCVSCATDKDMEPDNHTVIKESDLKFSCPDDCNSDCIQSLYQRRIDYLISQIKVEACPDCERFYCIQEPYPRHPGAFERAASKHQPIRMAPNYYCDTFVAHRQKCGTCEEIRWKSVDTNTRRQAMIRVRRGSSPCEDKCEGECIVRKMEEWSKFNGGTVKNASKT